MTRKARNIFRFGDGQDMNNVHAPRRVTGYTVTDYGTLRKVTATASRSGGHWHWYRDGEHLAGPNTEAYIYTRISDADGAKLVARCVRYFDHDPRRQPPLSAPAYRTIAWPTVTNAYEYVCAYATGQSTPGAEDWTTFATVRDDGRSHFAQRTPRLTTLTYYWFRVTPRTRAGNEGTAATYGPAYIVCKPAWPDVTLTYDDGTGQVTIAAAS